MEPGTSGAVLEKEAMLPVAIRRQEKAITDIHMTLMAFWLVLPSKDQSTSFCSLTSLRATGTVAMALSRHLTRVAPR